MRVLLRADATPEGGVGHVSRVAAVAGAAAAAGWEVVLSGRILTPLARSFLEGLPIDLVEPADDAASLGVLARRCSAQVVHVDDYRLGRDLRSEVGAAGAILSSIEDGPFGRRPADLVIDPAPPAFADDRGDDGSFRLVGGPGFVPLRPAVLAARRTPAAASPIVVSMGGTDAFGVSGAVLALLARVGVDRPVVLIAADPPVPPPGLDLTVLAPRPELAALFASAHLVITGSGTTMWELAAAGVPAAAVLLTENQRLNYEWAVAHRVAVGLGGIGDLTGATAAALLGSALREPLSPEGRGVDGQGASRIVDAWSHLGDPADTIVRARPAVLGDASRLLAWRNDPVTRAMSRAVDAVPWLDHRVWLERVLADPARILLIAERGREALGTVRLDRATSTQWEVSITLAPAARGRGLAGEVLAAGLAAAPGGVTLVAEISEQNGASQSLFRRAGFVADTRPATQPGFVRWMRDSPLSR